MTTMTGETDQVIRQVTATAPCRDCGEPQIQVLMIQRDLDGYRRDFRRAVCAGCGKVRSTALRFGVNATHPEGIGAVKSNCRFSVPEGGRYVGHRQCGHRAMAGPDGKYCGRHAREVAERRDAAMAV